jgi:hypothetical protein
MKAIKPVYLLILIFLGTVTFAQEVFEGKVVFNVEEKGNKQVMDYYAKNEKYRMEMPDKGGIILFNKKKLKMYVLMEDQKMYIESDMFPLSTTGDGGSISKTSETKNILGYDCEKFVFEQKDMKGEAWMTKELGTFMFFIEEQKEMPSWQSEIVDAGYFPLQVTQHDERRNVTSVYDVKEVTPMKLSDDLFEVPQSYNKLDMMNMGNLKNLFGK